MEFETIILRFRDLVENTIVRHQEIIKKNQHVWWGWWNKPNEKIPYEEFALLSAGAKLPQKLLVYLFDSGNKLLYKAVCSMICFKSPGEEGQSPEPENTPVYYNTAKYLAWFKFESIELIKDDVNTFLKNFSYFGVKSFFKSNNSNFDMYNDKIICSVDELWDQQRTIWFIRHRLQSDDIEEIRLVNSKKTEPTNVDHDYKLCESNEILWLSDLHFSDVYQGKCYHAFSYNQNEANSKLPLNMVIKNSLDNNNIKQLAGVIVSGDLTWSAKETEFNKAHKFCGDLISSYKLDRYQYAIIPGNHDMAYSDKPYEQGQEITKTSFEASQEYMKFYKNFFYLQPSQYLYCVRKLLLKNLTPIEIICLNSNMLQQDGKHFQGHGFVGQYQLNEIEDKLSCLDGNDTKAIRILVLHHHLMPVSYIEQPKIDISYSVTLDSEEIVQFILKHNVDIVLHGHMHEKFFAKVSRFNSRTKKLQDYNLIGNGSAGVISSEIPSNAHNMITVLDFNRINYLTVKQIEIDTSGQHLGKYEITIPLESEENNEKYTNN